MKLHLVDGTYELFRAYFGAPKATAADGRETGAVRGLLRTLLALLREPDVSHVGVAFDHCIESFRNRLFGGYKTSEGVPEDLLAQFEPAEDAARALGLVVWPMVEFEADDALATAAARWRDAPGVEQVVLCSPDKDLAQCVVADRVVWLDRLRRILRDEAGVWQKFGVAPASIPDWLALVGDSADGIPGIPRWGKTSAAALLARYATLEAIPDDPSRWKVEVRGAPALAASLRAQRADAALYKVLATLRLDASVAESLDDLRWRGYDRDRLARFCRDLGDDDLAQRIVAGAV